MVGLSLGTGAGFSNVRHKTLQSHLKNLSRSRQQGHIARPTMKRWQSEKRATWLGNHLSQTEVDTQGMKLAATGLKD